MYKEFSLARDLRLEMGESRHYCDSTAALQPRAAFRAVRNRR